MKMYRGLYSETKIFSYTIIRNNDISNYTGL